MNPNILINGVVNWIKTHPLYALLGLLVLVLLFFWATGSLGAAIENWRANRFDKRQAEYEKQIGDLKAEREALIKRANEAEANALLKEAEANELKELIEAKGGQIEAAANELERKLDEAKRDAGSCANAPDPVVCVCAKLRAAGFDCH